MNYKLTSIIIGSALMGAASILNAQDKQTLDLLVSKNVITKAEADAIAKEAVVVKPKQSSVKGITLSGRVQAQALTIGVDQYDSSGNKTASNTKSDFLMRRLYLGMSADLGAGWNATIVADFMSSNNSIDTATISKKFDGDFLAGTLDIGFKKVNFGVEENTSSSKLITIERSLATRYFNEGNDSDGVLGLGGRHTGIFWSGKVKQVKGLEYGLSLNNNYSNDIGGQTSGSSYMFTASAAYGAKFENFDFKVGVNFLYGDEMDSAYSNGTGNDSMYGVNPYIKASAFGVDMFAEMLWAEVKDGAADGSSASPMGFNIGAEYKFDIGDYGKIAPAIRYSLLDTDGRGADVSDGIRKASYDGSIYNAAQSIYIGVNWYIKGDDIKLQMGYEWAQYNDEIVNAQNIGGYATANAFRAQMQLLF